MPYHKQQEKKDMNPLGRNPETTPLLQSTSVSRTSPPQQGNWKESLVRRPPASMQTWSAGSKALISKFSANPQTVPDQEELSGLICTLMFHGEVEALHPILAQERLPMLHITSMHDQKHRDLSLALQTLLKAMPDPLPVKGLTLTNQHLDTESCSLLFKLFEQMPALESLHLYSGSVNNPWFGGLPDCCQLPRLQKLRFEKTQEASPFLEKILRASPQLSVLHLDSNYGFTVEQHRSLALALKQHHLGLRELTLGQLGNVEFAESVLHSYAFEFLAHQTTLEHLDVSGSPLTSNDCTVLWKALHDKTSLTSLSLANCWVFKDYATELARLVGLTSLVSVDLSQNQFSEWTRPVLMSLANHPGLQHLNLSSSMDDELIEALAFLLANNKALTSLELPVMSDRLYADLVTAMQTNQTLRSLSIKGIERQCSLLTAEERQVAHPNYLALMNCITLNREQWEKQNDKN